MRNTTAACAHLSTHHVVHEYLQYTRTRGSLSLCRNIPQLHTKTQRAAQSFEDSALRKLLF